jgi:arsenate reductase
VLHGDRIEPCSAGIEKHGLDRRAVEVMQEAGVDISRQRSKTIVELGPAEFDLVVTVCEDADKRCPAFPGGARKIHVGFPDPPRLAQAAASEAEALAHYRRVRDEIQAFVERLPREFG